MVLKYPRGEHKVRGHEKVLLLHYTCFCMCVQVKLTINSSQY